MKKKDKKPIIVAIVVAVVILVSALYIFRGNIYKMAVKYEEAGNRKSYDVKEEAFAQLINRNLPNDESLDDYIEMDQIVDFSLEITAKILDHFPDAPTNDPHKTLLDGYANYSGYAAFTASVGKYLVRMFGFDKEWEVKPKKAKLYIFGTNKSHKAKDGWFKDHDIVVFRNKKTKEEIYVDPSAYEAFGTKRVDKLQK